MRKSRPAESIGTIQEFSTHPGSAVRAFKSSGRPSQSSGACASPCFQVQDRPRRPLPAACRLHAAAVKLGSHGVSAFPRSHIARRLRDASSLFRRQQFTPENIDEVHLLTTTSRSTRIQRPRTCRLRYIASRVSYCCAATADDAEPTRLPISGVGATGT